MSDLALGRRRIGDVAVVEAGRGDPLLCLHGIGSSADAFRHQLDGLADTHRVLAWDAPGYGASPDPSAPPGLAGFAEASYRLLVDTGAEPAHVLGVSFGGAVAVQMALAYPEAVRSLVLADTSAGSAVDPIRARAMRQRSDDLIRLGPVELARVRAPRLVSASASPALVEEVSAIMALAVRLPGYAWAAEAMAATDLRAELTDLCAPTLVVVGENDAVTPASESRLLAAAIPGARLVVVSAAGHLANQEQPAQFNDVVRRFLDDTEAPLAGDHAPRPRFPRGMTT